VYRELVEEDGLAATEVDWGSLLPIHKQNLF
jgi:hypothetical protein